MTLRRRPPGIVDERRAQYVRARLISDALYLVGGALIALGLWLRPHVSYGHILLFMGIALACLGFVTGIRCHE